MMPGEAEEPPWEGAGGAGTRFRLFAQSPNLAAFRRPVVVSVSSPRGSVAAGPDDGFIYAVDPISKTLPYGPVVGRGGRLALNLPPWTGPAHAPALPDADGNFDHLRPGDPGFEAAHAYGCVRLAFDTFERYLGRPMRFHFVPEHPRLELAISPWYDNAQAGYGYIEIGSN